MSTNQYGIQFFDEGGINPLPAGVQVTVTSNNPHFSTIIATTVKNGVIMFSVALIAGGTYTASFSGPQAPITVQSFLASSSPINIVLVANFISPTFLKFYDQTGENPLPAGIRVSIVLASAPTQIIASGYTFAGGSVNIALSPGESCIAAFYGTQAPTGTQAFTAGLINTATSITVANYISSTFVTTSYANEQSGYNVESSLWPRGWIGVGAQPGGIAYAIACAMGACLMDVDEQNQYVLGMGRLGESFGSDIDSWANDFIGPGVWQRGPQEEDASYYARILLWLQAPFATLYGIQEILQAYIYSQTTASILEPLAFDEQGALDEFGALDGNILTNVNPLLPTIQVFDYKSNPTLSANVGLVEDEGQFAILFNFPNALAANNWFAGVSFAGINTFAASPSYTITPAPTAQIAQIVNTIKAAGTWPIYVSNVVA